jgi:hypothetical protein
MIKAGGIESYHPEKLKFVFVKKSLGTKGHYLKFINMDK